MDHRKDVMLVGCEEGSRQQSGHFLVIASQVEMRSLQEQEEGGHKFEPHARLNFQATTLMSWTLVQHHADRQYNCSNDLACLPGHLQSA